YVLLARGKATEARDVFEQIGSQPVAPGYFRYLLTRARVRMAFREPEGALEDLLGCGRLEEEWDIRTPAFGMWRPAAAPLLASFDRQDEARAVAREDVERCRAFGAPGPLGTALRSLGLVEPGETGTELPEQSLVQPHQSPRPP